MNAYSRSRLSVVSLVFLLPLSTFADVSGNSDVSRVWDEVLDEIVERYVELEQSARQIIEDAGLDPETVYQTVQMIDRAQHKRDQAAVVLKVTARSFGGGRPMPIVMKWQEPEMARPESVEAAKSVGSAVPNPGRKDEVTK